MGTFRLAFSKSTSITFPRCLFRFTPAVALVILLTVGSQASVSYAQEMFWSAVGRIKQADLNGNRAEDVISEGIEGPAGIALDQTGGKLYWTDPLAGRIQRVDLDGSDLENLAVSGLRSPQDIELDFSVQKIYWTDSGTGKIQRAQADGSDVEDLITGLTAPQALALDLAIGKIYWTDVSSGKIFRANTDGSEIQEIVADLEAPYGLDLHFATRKIYWTDRDSGKIQRADFDGSNVEDIIVGQTRPYGIDIDYNSNKIYWIGNPSIRRSSLDGENVEELLESDAADFFDIALGIATECLLVLDVTEGTVLLNNDIAVDATACGCVSGQRAVRIIDKFECERYLGPVAATIGLVGGLRFNRREEGPAGVNIGTLSTAPSRPVPASDGAVGAQ